MTVRIVVADRSAARFYEADRLGGPLRFFDDLQHPQARLREHDEHRREMEVFAKQIADVLSAEHALRHFDKMVLMVEPAFLGALRAVLPAALRAITVAEIGKDVMHESSSGIEQAIEQMLTAITGKVIPYFEPRRKPRHA